jgi:hypothetical protein
MAPDATQHSIAPLEHHALLQRCIAPLEHHALLQLPFLFLVPIPIPSYGMLAGWRWPKARAKLQTACIWRCVFCEHRSHLQAVIEGCMQLAMPGVPGADDNSAAAAAIAAGWVQHLCLAMQVQQLLGSSSRFCTSHAWCNSKQWAASPPYQDLCLK